MMILALCKSINYHYLVMLFWNTWQTQILWEKKYDEVGEINSKLGQKKGSLSTTKNNRKKNKDKIAEYKKKIDSLKRYRERVISFKEGKKIIKKGKGIYTQKKRNAYKINPKLVFTEM